MRAPPIPEPTLARIRSMRRAGMGWAEIARTIGVGYERLRRAVSPEYRERRDEAAKWGMRRLRAEARRG